MSSTMNHVRNAAPTLASQRRKSGRMRQQLKEINKYRFFYLLALPGLLYFVIFHYIPMFGVIIAFKEVSPFGGVAGIFTADWVGLKHFKRFYDSIFFWNVMRNTVLISGYKILFGFPAPIILALMINEVRRHDLFKRIVQTISYLPHFISWVVVTGLILALLTTQGGLINTLIKSLGGEPILFLGDENYFRSILVISHVWKTIGWSSILYLAAMSSISPSLYEAAAIDGANLFQQAWHITIPGIAFVIVILFIFETGRLFNAGFEQILLLYSSQVYSVADIIDTYVYREGLIGLKYSFAAAVGLFKSVLALVVLLATNKLAHRLGHTGIW